MQEGSRLKDVRDWLADPRGLSEAMESHRRVQDLRESISEIYLSKPVLVKPDGSPFPHHKSILKTGDMVPIRGQSFRVAYVGETSVLLEPMGPTDFVIGVAGEEETDET